MIGCVTAEGIAASSKTAEVRGAVPGPAAPLDPGTVDPEGFRRGYITEGHAALSPSNPAGMTSQSARVADLCMTTVGRRP